MAVRFRTNETTTVKTASGKVRGFFCDDVYIFRGIPYAVAKRFQVPEPVPVWDGVKDTTSYGYVCPLLTQPTPGGELAIPHRYWLMDENCQNLNVWTPGLDDHRRPVLVWLHGGGYSAGSAIEQVAYDGENMSRYGDVVLVTINHRLNILGYFDLSAYSEKYADSANAGGNDIIAALKWVHENIAAFGGDPNNVTVFGQSGGGGKVSTLLQSPAADGLYHKGVIMSGIGDPTLLSGALLAEGEDPKPLVQAVLRELGLEESQVEQLETVPYAQFAEAYNKVAPALKQAGCYIGCAPKKGASFHGDPLRVGFREETKEVPLMVGTVYGEASLLFLDYDKQNLSEEDAVAVIERHYGHDKAMELIPIYKAAYPERSVADMVCFDVFFRPSTKEYIKLRSKNPASTVYSYQFNMDFFLEKTTPAWHCSDIPFFFHNVSLVPGENVPGISSSVEDEVFGALMAFAKSGNPNHPEIPKWQKCTGTEEAVMRFGEKTEVWVNADDELIPMLAPEIIRDMMSQLKKLADKQGNQNRH